MGEMLHQATHSGEDYVFLKMDVVKAFDRLEWTFLLALLGKNGMAGLLPCFLKAGFATASSAVILNGISTEHFSIKRSVR